MKEFNLKRLMDACPFISHISDETYEALFAYYIDIDVDLNKINVDNDIVNGIIESSLDEFFAYHENTDDVNTLVIDKENNFISYFN